MTWAISVPILVFLGLSVLDLGPMYATDRRQTSDKASLNAPCLLGVGHNKSTDDDDDARAWNGLSSSVRAVSSLRLFRRELKSSNQY